MSHEKKHSPRRDDAGEHGKDTPKTVLAVKGGVSGVNRRPFVAVQVGNMNVTLSVGDAVTMGTTLLQEAYKAYNDGKLMEYYSVSGADPVQSLSALINFQQYRDLVEQQQIAMMEAAQMHRATPEQPQAPPTEPDGEGVPV